MILLVHCWLDGSSAEAWGVTPSRLPFASFLRLGETARYGAARGTHEAGIRSLQNRGRKGTKDALRGGQSVSGRRSSLATNNVHL